MSPSLSPSGSSSFSPSVSPSLSPSVSPSISPSPSPGWTDYTRDDLSSLPLDDADLITGYSAQDILDVASNDVAWVSQTTTQYAVHQFKNYVTGSSNINLEAKCRSSLAPGSSIVKLQIYNRTTTTWVDVDSNNAAAAGDSFILSGNITPVNLNANYMNGSGVISCRIWQLYQ